jgi:hypothetical protein
MELRDFIVTPIVLLLIYAVAYWVRPYITDEITRKYFFPALTVRIIGALAVGFIYQFYYSGGDTFGYHTHGSRVVWEAFMDNPLNGLKLLFSTGDFESGTYKFASKIWFYRDPSSFFVIRVASVFDLLTFSSYSATAVLFAVLSFSGVWLLFKTFYSILPDRHFLFALSILFMPSVFFWGSGILKDSLTLTGVGWATYSVYQLFILRKWTPVSITLLLLGCLILYFTKLYILLCFLPAAIVWVFLANFARLHSLALKVLIAPAVFAMAGLSGYWAIVKVSVADKRYELDNLARTAYVTAYDIGFYTGRSAGSRYSLGELDPSFIGMLTKAPQAINVSLFRPYVWEVNNPFMAMAALESLVILGFTLFVIFRYGRRLFECFFNPVIIFCLVFSLTFAFAVGVSTYNFGTLVRYKIPLMPFYLAALILMEYYLRNDRKIEVLGL